MQQKLRAPPPLAPLQQPQHAEPAPAHRQAEQRAEGGGGGAVEDPNTLFSTDSLFVTTGFGEGPVYRINPNGPQDIEIQDGNIDD